jgi:hypothetical protein
MGCPRAYGRVDVYFVVIKCSESKSSFSFVFLRSSFFGLLKIMPTSVWALLTSVISQLASGIPLWKISLPASVHEPVSALQLHRSHRFSNGSCLDALDSIEECGDPVRRLGLLFIGVIDVSHVLETKSPYNPIEGEFTSYLATHNGKQFSMRSEQVSHYPPVSLTVISGPSFRLKTKMTNPRVAPSLFNSIDFTFDNIYILETKTHSMTITFPGLRLSPIIPMDQAKSYFRQDRFVIVDRGSGMRFEGSLKPPLKVRGKIMNKDNKILHSVNGNLSTGVKFDSGDVWITACSE